MVKFETIESTEVTFGKNNFIEVARKKAISEEGENTFISLSRGFFTPETKERRYKRNFSIPDDKEILGEILEAMKKLK